MRDLQVSFKAEPIRYSTFNSDSYCLTSGDWVPYNLIMSYYYQSEIELKGCTIEDITITEEVAGFWVKTGNPLKELVEKLETFEDLMQSVCDLHNANPRKYAKYMWGISSVGLLNVDSHKALPYIEVWVNNYKPSLLVIPSDLELAADHIYDLQYKYRKMVELWETVNNFKLDGFSLIDLIKEKV